MKNPNFWPHKNRLGNIFWMTFIVLLAWYGALAFNAGAKISPHINEANQPAEISRYIMQQTINGVTMGDTQEVEAIMPFWIKLIADISNSAYMYGQDSIIETITYYYEIDNKRRTVISTHMMLGVILLITGAFQFWPRFRRKNRKLHRYLGGIYILTGITSMSLSGHHLVYSGPANTFNTFTFYVGLWVMLIGVIVSMGMATYTILKKKIALHMGWQALGFGFFMTAPIQRIDWIILSQFSQDTSFNENNILVNAILLVQALMVAYVLFYINRQSGTFKIKAYAPPPPHSNKIRLIVYLAVFFVCILGFTEFIHTPGLSNSSSASLVVPETIIAHQSIIFYSPILPSIFFISSSLALFICARLLMATTTQLSNMNLEKALLLTSSLTISTVLFSWGYELGMPKHEYSVAGASYFSTGVVILIFTGLLSFSCKSNLAHSVIRIKEYVRFIMAAIAAPLLVPAILWIISTLNIVPEIYIANGHAHQLANISPIFTGILLAYLAAVYSSDTQRYTVS